MENLKMKLNYIYVIAVLALSIQTVFATEMEINSCQEPEGGNNIENVGAYYAPGKLECWEDCIPFNSSTAHLVYSGSQWRIVDGAKILYSFDASLVNAAKALQIIKAYKMSEQCFVGRPGPSME